MITIEQLQEWISLGESIEREFKSDIRQISDKEIYEEIVAFANTSGGILLIGVDDSGKVIGAKPRHGKTTDPLKLQSSIFNNTVPNINTRVTIIPCPSGNVLAIEVDLYPEPCATSEGRALHRTIKADGKPQTAPFYPRDQRSRRVDLGLLDFSSQTMDSVSFESLDPLEFERLRQTVSRLRGDRTLLELSNEEIAKALKLVETKGSQLVPNVAGLLILGREDVLANNLPTHEVHFQVMDDQGNVKVNDAFRWPLLRLINEIENRFNVRNQENEIVVGLFRVPIPDYSFEGFREAFNNAIIHRDYTRLGSVYVQLHHDHLLITNPGAFPAGITVENILVHEPKPRNPRLADAFKRIGIAEQTGRGVDRIYMGQLRYGRPPPDYTRSDSDGVRVVLSGGKASQQFSAFVYEQDKKGLRLTLDELMILNTLFFDRRIDSDFAGRLIQKGAIEARRILEHLNEKGLIEGKGKTKGRVYHLSAELYRTLGQSESYVRIHGISPIRQESMIMEYVQAHGRIERKHVMELCGLTSPQAGRLLKKMMKSKKLQRQGTLPRWTYYTMVK
jgi:ATP-dependent DNA helicase RecG